MIDMTNPLQPNGSEEQRERYLPGWTRDLLRELRSMIAERDNQLEQARTSMRILRALHRQAEVELADKLLRGDRS